VVGEAWGEQIPETLEIMVVQDGLKVAGGALCGSHHDGSP
jgi:hypothetical protein